MNRPPASLFFLLAAVLLNPACAPSSPSPSPAASQASQIPELQPGYLLFLSKPMSITPEELKAKLDPLFDSVSIEEDGSQPAGMTWTARLAIDGHPYGFSLAPRSSNEKLKQYAETLPDPRSRKILDDYQAVLSILSLDWTADARDAHDLRLLKVIHALDDPTVLGIGTEPATTIPPLDPAFRDDIEALDLKAVRSRFIPGTRVAEKEDPKVAAAIAEARRRWPEFLQQFKKGSLEYAVKVRFESKGETEFMWITPTDADSSTVKGTLQDDGVLIPSLKAGNSVTASLDKVADWAVLKDGQLVAGGILEAVLSQ
jgi:uncharacterized protein YegJ (DUF2314 family)